MVFGISSICIWGEGKDTSFETYVLFDGLSIKPRKGLPEVVNESIYL